MSKENLIKGAATTNNKTENPFLSLRADLRENCRGNFCGSGLFVFHWTNYIVPSNLYGSLFLNQSEIFRHLLAIDITKYVNSTPIYGMECTKKDRMNIVAAQGDLNLT